MKLQTREQRDHYRVQFADFLERLTSPDDDHSDWDQFIVVHYPDEFLEEMRRCTVRLAIDKLWALAILCSVDA
jgi:hypothetical protein